MFSRRQHRPWTPRGSTGSKIQSLRDVFSCGSMQRVARKLSRTMTKAHWPDADMVWNRKYVGERPDRPLSDAYILLQSVTDLERDMLLSWLPATLVLCHELSPWNLLCIFAFAKLSSIFASHSPAGNARNLYCHVESLVKRLGVGTDSNHIPMTL